MVRVFRRFGGRREIQERRLRKLLTHFVDFRGNHFIRRAPSSFHCHGFNDPKAKVGADLYPFAFPQPHEFQESLF